MTRPLAITVGTFVVHVLACLLIDAAPRAPRRGMTTPPMSVEVIAPGAASRSVPPDHDSRAGRPAASASLPPAPTRVTRAPRRVAPRRPAPTHGTPTALAEPTLPAQTSTSVVADAASPTEASADGTGAGVGVGDGGGDGSGGDGIDRSAPPIPVSTSTPRVLPYTAQAVANDISGIVRLELMIDASGRVARTRVATGLGAGLDEIATGIASKFTFRPALDRIGRPIPGTVIWRFRFAAPR